MNKTYRREMPIGYIARIFTKEKVKNWEGKVNWHASTLQSMLENEKYKGDAILQKGYTADFLTKNADYMAKHLKKYGWEYIVVDIEWYAKGAGTKREDFQYLPFGEFEMDEFSRLYPDKSRFPSSACGLGFQPLADYIHGLGLKFGIHIMRGIPRIAAHSYCPVLGTNESADMIADPASICGWNPDMYGVRANDTG